MTKKLTALIALIIGAVAYFFLKGFPLGWTILYPFQLLATILHEFGHATAALLTGGSVHRVQINTDGSGVTYTSGGWEWLVVAGGYIGSALFGNILLKAGLSYGNWSKYVLYGLLTAMLFIATVWSGSLGNTIFVACFAIGVYMISRMHEEITAWFLAFMGILCILHILEDYNNGPKSDLAHFASLVPILSQNLWMYVWLIVAGIITWLNVKRILSEE